jgi:hypothetical protein
VGVRLRSDEVRRGSLRFTLRSKPRLVEAAGVEYESDTTTIGVYANLPNVYRMTDFLILVVQSPLERFYFALYLNLNFHNFTSILFSS